MVFFANEACQLDDFGLVYVVEHAVADECIEECQYILIQAGIVPAQHSRPNKNDIPISQLAFPSPRISRHITNAPFLSKLRW